MVRPARPRQHSPAPYQAEECAVSTLSRAGAAPSLSRDPDTRCRMLPSPHQATGGGDTSASQQRAPTPRFPGHWERGRPKLQQLHSPPPPPPPAVMLRVPRHSRPRAQRVSPWAPNKDRNRGKEGRWKSPNESTGAREGGEVPTLCSRRQCGLHTTRAFLYPTPHSWARIEEEAPGLFTTVPFLLKQNNAPERETRGEGQLRETEAKN